MKLLQLNKIREGLIDSVTDSFDRLPHTDHKDGKYRLRRYSIVEIHSTFWNALIEPLLTRLEHRDFIQGEDLNKHQGGVLRSFEEIEEETIQSEGLHEICFAFKEANNLTDGQEIEIHQMRVVTQEGGNAPPSPEGIHQDGFDHIAVVGINRHNIEGGALLVYEDRDSDPFVEKPLLSGEMIMLDDTELWHNATPIKAMNKEEQGYADWFILCANKGGE